jgi:hypothetical protein
VRMREFESNIATTLEAIRKLAEEPGKARG